MASNERPNLMMVIGVDTHKSSHAMAAVAADTGLLTSEREIAASDDGHRAALSWARELDAERVWAIEDCRHVSRRLEQALITAGERVIRVPPKMMGQSRRGERESGKSDQIDARAVARAVLREGVERFPAAFLDERALAIRLLADLARISSRSAPDRSTACAGISSTSAPSSRPTFPPAGSIMLQRSIASPVACVARSAAHALTSPWSWWRASVQSPAKQVGCRASCARWS
jgi:transposase